MLGRKSAAADRSELGAVATRFLIAGRRKNPVATARGYVRMPAEAFLDKVLLRGGCRYKCVKAAVMIGENEHLGRNGPARAPDAYHGNLSLTSKRAVIRVAA